MTAARCVAAAFGFALATACPASAAYAPVTTLTFDTYSPAAAPAVTAAVRQASGEETTRAISARFPPGFTLNPAFAAEGCPVATAETGTCPPESRIGSASVQTQYGPGAGEIYHLEDFRLLIHLRALADLIQVRVFGAIRALDDGTAEITFDGLPRTPLIESRIALEGGAHAIFVNPRRCGRYVPSVRYVSHEGQTVTSELPIEITGCAAPPRVTAVRVTPARVRAGRAPVVSWRLDRPAATELTVLRASGGRWREVRRISAPGAAGANRVGLRGLRPGRYRVSLRARAQDGLVSRARSARLVVHGASG